MTDETIIEIAKIVGATVIASVSICCVAMYFTARRMMKKVF